MTSRTFATFLPVFALAACGQQDDGAVERVTLSGDAAPAPHVIAPSPDVAGAVWAANENGRTATFGKPGDAPLLTIACEMAEDDQPTIRIVRHVAADPGAKALFALVGWKNIGRIPADAKADGEKWHWESVLPATDPQLDVLADGTRIEATIPGGGTLEMAASQEPVKLLTACRALAPKAPEEPEAAEKPPA